MEDNNMSKKTAIIIILCGLIVCEKKWPTAGTDLLMLNVLR